MLNVLAPAKLNLTLEVLSRRPDGFHEICSVIQTISLCDNLRFEPNEDIKLAWDDSGIVPEESLTLKAVNLLKEINGCTKGAKIEVTKRIPLMSGMGGESSDAAAVLKGLNRLWELGLEREHLAKMAARLGSDVTFFLSGGTTLMEGMGEIIRPLPPIQHTWFIIVIPQIPRLSGKTGQLYNNLTKAHYTDGQVTESMVRVLEEGEEINAEYLFNTFETIAYEFYSGLDFYRDSMFKMGVSNVHLAGSGPGLFTMVNDRAQAEELYNTLQRSGLECYLADTLPAQGDILDIT